MKILRIYPTSINERFMDEAAGLIRDGEPVIIPTDSLYAIACDAMDNQRIERLCSLKGLNPRRDLLSIICSDISMASEYARIDNRAFAIMKRYLPGPVTFILPASTRLPKVFKGRRTVGIRIPDSPVAIDLVNRLGHPLMVTSVDLPEEIISDPEEIALRYANVVSLLLDAGSGTDIPSTVVDLTDSSDPKVIRRGQVDFEP